MKIRFNYWQTFLLFIPFIAGHLLLDSTNNNINSPTFKHYFKIANILTLLNIVIVIVYQSQIVMGFNNRLKRYHVFTFNTLLLALFFSLYFLYAFYYTFINPVPEQSINYGPVSKHQLNFFGISILLLLIHFFLTFFFINNYHVSTVSKKIEDSKLKLELTANYYNYLKILRNVALTVLIGYKLISAIIKLILQR